MLVATGRRPRVEGIGLETVGIEPDRGGVKVDDHLRAGERLWAIGDVNGAWPLTHVGKYEGDVVAANILGEDRPVNYDAVPRVTYTDPQAAAVGAGEGAFEGTARLSEIAKTATYTHAYKDSKGYLTLLSDGQVLVGAHALGPEAGEWLGQATVAIRAAIPLDVLFDTIQPFPTFSEIYVAALKALREAIRLPGLPVRFADVAKVGSRSRTRLPVSGSLAGTAASSEASCSPSSRVGARRSVAAEHRHLQQEERCRNRQPSARSPRPSRRRRGGDRSRRHPAPLVERRR